METGTCFKILAVGPFYCNGIDDHINHRGTICYWHAAPICIGNYYRGSGFCPLPWSFCCFCAGNISCPVRISHTGSLCLHSYVVLHNIEGYVLTPIIQEHIVAIPTAFLIIMQIMMYILFGPLGVLIATPLGVVIVVLVQTTYIEDILDDRVKVLGEK